MNAVEAGRSIVGLSRQHLDDIGLCNTRAQAHYTIAWFEFVESLPFAPKVQNELAQCNWRQYTDEAPADDGLVYNLPPLKTVLHRGITQAAILHEQGHLSDDRYIEVLMVARDVVQLGDIAAAYTFTNAVADLHYQTQQRLAEAREQASLSKILQGVPATVEVVERVKDEVIQTKDKQVEAECEKPKVNYKRAERELKELTLDLLSQGFEAGDVERMVAVERERMGLPPKTVGTSPKTKKAREDAKNKVSQQDVDLFKAFAEGTAL